MRRGLVVVCSAALLACSDGGGDVDAFCATAEGFRVDNPAAAFASIDPADPAGTTTALAGAAERLRAWADDAPEEVRDDVRALADAAATLAEAFEPAEDGSVEDDADATVDTEAVEQASARVLAFADEACGVDLDPDPAPSG